MPMMQDVALRGVQADRVEAAIVSLDSGQTKLREDFLGELGKTRSEIMERMDRLQGHVVNFDDHLTGSGWAYAVQRRP